MGLEVTEIAGPVPQQLRDICAVQLPTRSHTTFGGAPSW